jgi:uncharacterized repeat protein (TIGR04138 family)
VIDKDRIVRDIVARDPRYNAEAYDFVFEALDHTLRRLGGNVRHVTGAEIMESVRLLALEQFGFLARTVLSQWGIRRTDDFGHIVFNLIEADLLQKTANDRLEDFIALYDFEEAFDEAFGESLQSVEL